MSERPRKRRWEFWSVATPAGIAVLLLLYLLSVGPAHRLWYHDWISDEAFYAYSRPAILLTSASGKRRDYGWYLDWWISGDDTIPDHIPPTPPRAAN